MEILKGVKVLRYFDNVRHEYTVSYAFTGIMNVVDAVLWYFLVLIVGFVYVLQYSFSLTWPWLIFMLPATHASFFFQPCLIYYYVNAFTFCTLNILATSIVL